MADESQTTVRGINWRDTFPFTQIFKAFRVAIHPTKLILALAALLSLYVGGRVLDAIWPIGHRAVPNEIGMYETWSAEPSVEPFEREREKTRAEIESFYAQQLRGSGVETDEAKAKDAAKSGSHVGDLKAKLVEQRDKHIKSAGEARDNANKSATDRAAAGDKNVDVAAVRKDADAQYAKTVREVCDTAATRYEQVQAIRNKGVFYSFFEYETNQINNVANAVLANNWLSGFANAPVAKGAGPGVFASIKNFVVTGPWWMISQHTYFFILFSILFSVVWAVFGGAISRIAAVHVARDEKVSLSGALRFSTGKFLSFMFAPIIPLLIVLVVGLVVALGGLIGNIPWVGPFLMGLFFFLALAAGFVMTLVLLGTAGGFNLMYPTIAVEGSDSFDAISRSFSYVYARPWRMLFYTLVSIVYGALCFLFVQFFIRIMLSLTHGFVGWGMMKDIDSSTPIDLWSRMWPAPTARFSFEIDTINLHSDQVMGSFMISLWVYAAVGLLGAFVISFYFSANTIIYYLMRREVDATELDDVYLEQTDEDFGDAATAAPGALAPVTTPAAPGTSLPVVSGPMTGGTIPVGVATPGTTTVVTPTGTTTLGDNGGAPPAADPAQPTPPPAGG